MISSSEIFIQELIFSIIDRIPDYIPYSISIDPVNKMDLEEDSSSSISSSSDDSFLKNKIKISSNGIPYIEESEGEDTNIAPEEKFRTKNEKKITIINKLESKEERETRYGISQDQLTKIEMKSIGQIFNFIENSIIIKPLMTENVIDLDNLVFNQNKEIIGKIDDVFGNIESPFYMILIEPYIQEKIKNGEIEKNMSLYVASDSKVILKAQIDRLKKQKGCDASNKFDEEIDPKEIDCSDDELEQNKKSKKQKNKPNDFNQEKESRKHLKINKYDQKFNKYRNNIDQIQNGNYSYNQNYNSSFNQNQNKFNQNFNYPQYQPNYYNQNYSNNYYNNNNNQNFGYQQNSFNSNNGFNGFNGFPNQQNLGLEINMGRPNNSFGIGFPNNNNNNWMPNSNNYYKK